MGPRTGDLLGAVVALGLLSGCATNAVRIERASAVVVAGAAAAERTEALWRDVDQANRATAIDVATLDPACRLPEPVIGLGRPRAKLLCRDGAARPGDVALTRLRAADFAPSAATLEGLTVYLAAIDEIVTGEPVDLGRDVAVAEDALKMAGGLELDADQKAAVDGALGLLGELAAERREVDRLRALSSPAKIAAFDSAVDALRRSNERWLTVLDSELASQSSVQSLSMAMLIGRASLAERRLLREQQMAQSDRASEIPALRLAYGKLATVLAQSHASYVTLLRGDRRDLTPEERAKAARLERERIVAALNGIRRLIRTF